MFYNLQKRVFLLKNWYKFDNFVQVQRIIELNTQRKLFLAFQFSKISYQCLEKQVQY